jgi:predicted deacylase
VCDPLKTILGTEPGAARELRRLGKNVNGYLGERIDIAAILADCVAAARAHGWTVEEFHPAPRRLLAFTRAGSRSRVQTSPLSKPPSSASRPCVYLSTGIHGDEPAGPLAVRQLLEEDRWAANCDLWLCPCLNTDGFVQNRRENPDGLDLNREYLKPKAGEIIAHTAWLNRQPRFDLCLSLHEDWEARGFYVYELNPDNRPSVAEAMVARVAEVCPIDGSEIIEGRPAHNGIIRPPVDPRARPQWPESFFLLTHKTRLACTLEAPSDFPLSARIAALVVAVNAALEKIGGLAELGQA